MSTASRFSSRGSGLTTALCPSGYKGVIWSTESYPKSCDYRRWNTYHRKKKKEDTQEPQNTKIAVLSILKITGWIYKGKTELIIAQILNSLYYKELAQLQNE